MAEEMISCQTSSWINWSFFTVFPHLLGLSPRDFRTLFSGTHTNDEIVRKGKVEGEDNIGRMEDVDEKGDDGGEEEVDRQEKVEGIDNIDGKESIDGKVEVERVESVNGKQNANNNGDVEDMKGEDRKDEDPEKVFLYVYGPQRRWYKGLLFKPPKQGKEESNVSGKANLEVGGSLKASGSGVDTEKNKKVPETWFVTSDNTQSEKLTMSPLLLLLLLERAENKGLIRNVESLRMDPRNSFWNGLQWQTQPRVPLPWGNIYQQNNPEKLHQRLGWSSSGKRLPDVKNNIREDFEGDKGTNVLRRKEKEGRQAGEIKAEWSKTPTGYKMLKPLSEQIPKEIREIPYGQMPYPPFPLDNNFGKHWPSIDPHKTSFQDQLNPYQIPETQNQPPVDPFAKQWWPNHLNPFIHSAMYTMYQRPEVKREYLDFVKYSKNSKLSSSQTSATSPFDISMICSEGCGLGMENGFYRSCLSCSKYYMCVDGAKEERLCAGDLVFDHVTKQCDVAENVNCGEVIDVGLPGLTFSERIGTNVETPNVEKRRDKEEILDGRKERGGYQQATFYEKRGGIGENEKKNGRWESSGNSKINRKRDWDIEINGERDLEEEDDPVCIRDCYGIPDGSFASCDLCSAYHVCWWGTTWTKYCEPDQLFHPVHRQCMDELLVQCPWNGQLIQ